MPTLSPSDLINNPTSTAIATGSALRAFLGASLAFFTGNDERMERYAVRGSVFGGLAGIAVEIAGHITLLSSPTGELTFRR